MESTKKMFPILIQCSREVQKQLKTLGCPKSIPWSALEPYRQNALKNHGQTLERLAERGGLSPAEVVWLIGECSFSDITSGRVTDVDSVSRVRKLAGLYP